MEGEHLGPYAIGRELGSGGMGKVYAATVEARTPGLETGAQVALKLVHAHLLETAGFFRRFMQEAQIGASIRHDNVVRTFMADGEDLNFLFGSYPPSGAATASGAFSAAYREHFGEAGSAEYLTQTPILVPALDALLKGESAPTGVELLTKDSLQTCFVNVTRSLSAERPTVVLIDDLHFAPDEGRALFTSLAMAAPGARVLLVGTTRPGVSEDWMAGLTRLDQTSQIALHRLGPKDLADLLGDCFKSSELAHPLGVQVGIKSDGNPFFAFEIIRGLREGQFITQKDDGTWASTRIIDEIQIPSSVLDLVNARVASLSQEERDVLDVAACWGYEFDPALLSDVTGIARIPLYKQLAQIERAHRLVRSSGRSFVFDHHQVQEALYSSLPEVLREEYHGALADALAARTKAADEDPEELDGALCVDLCEHYLKGARGEDARRYLKAAQTHLTKGYLHAQVVALTERALAVPNLLVGIDRAKTLLRLASALDRMGRRARQEEAAREAERLAEDAGDDDVRGTAALALGGCLYRTSRHEEAEAAFRRAQEIAVSRGNRAAEAIALHNLGGAHREAGESAQSEERLQACLVLCGEIGHRHAECATHLALGSLRAAQSLSAGSGGEGGRESLVAARDLAAEVGIAGVETLARCELACLPGGDAQDALAAFTEHEERLSADECPEAHYLLFRATGDRAHLDEAKRLLDEQVATHDDETRQRVLTVLRLPREILAAWRTETGEADDPDEPQGTESITKAGLS